MKSLIRLFSVLGIYASSSDIKQDVFAYPKYHVSFSQSLPLKSGSERVDLIANLNDASERFKCWIPNPSGKEVESQARRTLDEMLAAGLDALKWLPCLQFVRIVVEIDASGGWILDI
jgi:hypothetical protein